MEEQIFIWQKIQENHKLIENKKSLVEAKIALLKKELEKLELEESKLVEDASEDDVVQISVGDFEKAAQKIDPKHLPIKVSIRYDDVERQCPLTFKDPDDLKAAKNYNGTHDYRDGQIELRINNMSRYLLRKCYLPESCEQKENPTVQDLVMCFWSTTVARSRKLIDIFAQAEKDRAQATSQDLSDGGKQ